MNRFGALKNKTFKTLQELISLVVDAHDELIAEVDQRETYYLMRSSNRQKPNSYFASLQVRIDGVYLQLHTFLKPPKFDAKIFPKVLAPYVSPSSRSLVLMRLNNKLEAEISKLIDEALIKR